MFRASPVRISLAAELNRPAGSAQEQQGAAAGWMTVPAFGEWDVKNGAVPD